MLQIAAMMAASQNFQTLEGPDSPISMHVSLPRPGERDLEMRVCFPKQEGRFPVIIFSHGLRGSMDSYDPLIKTWVSHGYICIQPNHADSFQYFRGNPQEMFKIDASSVGNWKERPREISMIIDRLNEIERQAPGLASRIDPKVIGVGGHSFGAQSSQLIGGAKPMTGDSFKDPRARAILLISPQGQGNTFNGDAWKAMTEPVLDVTGSDDVSITRTTPEIRRQPFQLSPPGDKYLLWIEGGHHGMGGITGRWFPTAGPPNPSHLLTVQTVTLAFWDAYLKHDEKAKRFLVSGDVKALSAGAAYLQRR